MRRLLLILLLGGGLCVPGAGRAQAFSLGVEAGAAVSEFSADPADLPTGTVTGFVAGATLRYEPGPVAGLGLRSGLSFAERGGALGAAGGGTALDVFLDYLEVPLVLDLESSLPEFPVTPRLFAGGSVGFELACRLRQRSLSRPDVRAPCESDERAVNEFESASTVWALLAGGGVAVPVGPGQATVQAEYRLGLTNVNAQDVEPRTVLESRSWSFTAGYRVRLD